MHPTVFTRLLAVLLTGWAFTSAHAQLSDSLIGPEHPAIGYGIRPATDPVARLNERLQAGQIHLRFDSRGGHLRSLLEALGIPVESQLAVFSRNSLQAHLIGPRNPRTIFFNDSVIVAWMRGGFIEVAAHDVQQGAVFYRLTQGGLSGSTQLRRDDSCIRCHYSTTTVGVPGFLVRSVPGGADGSIMPWLGSYVTDHRSPIEERWAGWYVTGRAAGRHLGNAPVSDWTTKELRVADANLNLETVANRFDTKEYLTPHSDIVALMVFDHQMRMMNLLTRIGWEVRVAEHERRSALAGRQLRVAAVELVDYLLFVDESRSRACAAHRGSQRSSPRWGRGIGRAARSATSIWSAGCSATPAAT